MPDKEDKEKKKIEAKIRELRQTKIGKKIQNDDKAIPLQAWTVPEGSRRLRLPHFKTIGT